jgi:hypothetical protein
MGEKRNTCRILVEMSEAKKQQGRCRLRSEDNIKMDLKEIGWGGMDGLIWLRIATSGGLLRTR